MKTNNIYLFLLMKMFWALVALFATQVLFYLLNQPIFCSSYSSSEVWSILVGNMRFGMASVSLFMLPYLVMMLLPFDFRWKKGYRIATEWVLAVCMVVALGANIADSAYYQFSYRRLSSEIFVYLTIGGQMGTLVPKFIVDYWQTSLFGTLIILVYLIVSLQIKLVPRKNLHSHVINDWIGTLVSAALIVVMARGGFGKCILLTDAGKYSRDTSLITNSCYSVIRTAMRPDLDEVHFHSDQEVESILGEYQRDVVSYDSLFCIGAGKKVLLVDSTWQTCRKNVVVIMLESFSQEYMGCYGNDSFTPFLDSLARMSYVFDGRSNGKKSIEALPAVFASLPTLMEKPICLSRYKQNQFNGIPYYLRSMGYHTAFFHGCYNGSMAFDSLCYKIGFEQYYGMDEYVAKHGDATYDHVWGIYDEPFLQYMAETMTSFKEPFMTGVFTISSHHPYSIPEQHKGKFKKGKHPLLQCVNYGDYALRCFFETASKQPWFNNTIFVITGDHPGQGMSPEYNQDDTWYRVPMLFYVPGDSLRSGLHSQRIVQQIDIMPTILDYLGCEEYKSNDCLFGNSIFRSKDGFHIVYGHGRYMFISQQDALNVHDVCWQFGSEPVCGGSQNSAKVLTAFRQKYYNALENNLTTTK